MPESESKESIVDMEEQDSVQFVSACPSSSNLPASAGVPPLPLPAAATAATSTSSSYRQSGKPFVPHIHSSGCFGVIASKNGNHRYKCLCKDRNNAKCTWEGKHQSAKRHLESCHTDADLSRFTTATRAGTKPLSQPGSVSETQPQLDLSWRAANLTKQPTFAELSKRQKNREEGKEGFELIQKNNDIVGAMQNNSNIGATTTHDTIGSTPVHSNTIGATTTHDNIKATKQNLFPNVIQELVLHSKALLTLMTILRNKETSCEAFVRASDRVCMMLVEEGLSNSFLAFPHQVKTPTHSSFVGLALPSELEAHCCMVSICRSGDILSKAFKSLHPGISEAKILIQRKEHTVSKESQVIWHKVPTDIHQKKVVFVLDPMLATGGSAINCLEFLQAGAGVDLARVMFLNIVSCPEGLIQLRDRFPQVRIITCAIDDGLNESRYIFPGLGDYGDRYFGT